MYTNITTVNINMCAYIYTFIHTFMDTPIYIYIYTHVCIKFW